MEIGYISFFQDRTKIFKLQTRLAYHIPTNVTSHQHNTRANNK